MGEGSLYLVTERESVCVKCCHDCITLVSFFFFLLPFLRCCSLHPEQEPLRSLVFLAWGGKAGLVGGGCCCVSFLFFFSSRAQEAIPSLDFLSGGCSRAPAFPAPHCEGPASLTAPQPPPSLILSLPRLAFFYLTYRSSTTVAAVYCNQ